MNVYRIQPKNSQLHAQQSTTSNDEQLPGVFVFESLPEVWACREWLNEKNVELVTIECEQKDLKHAGDYEGALLKEGCGVIVSRKSFKDVKAVAKWVKSQI